MNEHAVRVLLVDDEEDQRLILADGLRRDGYTVDVAADGSQALERFGAASYDVLVTDIVMPLVDGIVLLSAIRQRHQQLLRVVMTSFADKENIKAVLNAGADHLIEKPFTAATLARVLRDLLAEAAPDDDGDDAVVSALYERRLETLPINSDDRLLITYILKGLANRQIADLLASSEQVIKNRISRVYRRLGICSRNELFHLVFPI